MKKWRASLACLVAAATQQHFFDDHRKPRDHPFYSMHSSLVVLFQKENDA
jgi:hypothetical protein